MDRLLDRDVTIKLLSLALAVMLWLQATGEQNKPEEASFTVPVQVLRVSGSVVRVNDGSRPTVHLTVRGGRRHISRLRTAGVKELSASVDASEVQPGTQRLRVNVRVPSGVEVVSVSPDEIPLEFERKESRAFDVRAVLSGEVSPGFRVAAAAPSATSATVVGGVSRLERIASVAAFVTLSGGESSDMAPVVTLVAVDAEGKIIPDVTVEPAETEVKVSIAAVPPGRALPVEIALSGSLPVGYLLGTPVAEPADATVRGPRSVIDALEQVATEPVELSTLTADFEGMVRLALPAGVEFTEPESVRIRIPVTADIISRVFDGLSIQVRQLDPGLRAELSTTTASVTLRGLRPFVEEVAKSDIIVTVSLANLRAGTYQIPLRVAVGPAGLELAGVSPEAVRVVLRPK